MRLVTSNYARSSILIAAISALLGAAGCATSNSATPENTAPDRVSAREFMDRRAPVIMDRKEVKALAKGAINKVFATDIAAQWQKDKDTDQRAVVLLPYFNNEAEPGLGASLGAVHMHIETRVINESGASVMDISGYERPETKKMRRTKGHSEAEIAESEAHKAAPDVYTITGTLTGAHVDADRTDYTLTLRIRHPSHEGPLAEVSETVRAVRWNGEDDD